MQPVALPPSLHVLVRREDVDPARLAGRVVVVIDVLFATSTIVHALGAGATAVYPARDDDDARAAAACRPGVVVAGEYMARTLPGHAPATPLALAPHLAAGGELVYLTTNGTRAIAACTGAAAVYAGALGNAGALARHVVARHSGQPVLLLCAGSLGRFSLEDFVGAGHLVRALRAAGVYAPSDAALAAEFASLGMNPGEALSTSRVGRMLSGAGLDAEIAHAAACDTCDVVPVLRDGVLVRAAA
ncbi:MULTISPECIES: 2-phosphosulfolactate phosphatase [unclassified Luteimonas]|uniref:2-phosphosulfolactate phosphatase n=1 Tax=unclassified Luteimonas TaxID=2629088 RepID=UPI0018F0A9D9|nr:MULTISPECIES: 2-phosphosulfolactate phosphatase [unclassified Luteimonas]MBJ6978377.1 2-phosphosulfolactate phosphatase [Luteimonas sp. MC1895]MBJ6983841.1 2-phosphosulfolactate phosphatase [Luteimonas sp. MC1750]QQO06664.1 2-phosphosulfolactate phosphatase [Luteimonas sp. MC1750]